MRVGLVIVTFNGDQHIARCLEAVAAQTRPPDRVIVADNGSTDRTIALVNETAVRLSLRVEVLPLGRNLGFAVANNRAVAALADCDGVALLNPDAFPQPWWLAALTAAADVKSDAASFASRLMIDGRDQVLDGAGDVFHVSGLAWRQGHRQPLAQVSDALTAHPVFAACAAAALYRREDWCRVGGFDEHYFCYAEDLDLGFRLQLLGRGCWYVPEAVVQHVGSATSGEDSPFSVYHGYRNLEWTFIKNMPATLFWRYLPLHAIAIGAQLGWFVRKGRGASLLRAKWDALRGMSRVLAERRHVQKTRVISARSVAALLDRTSLRQRFGTVRRTE